MVSIRLRVWCSVFDTECFKCIFYDEGRCPYLTIVGGVKPKKVYWCIQCKSKIVDVKKHHKMYPDHVLVEWEEKK